MRRRPPKSKSEPELKPLDEVLQERMQQQVNYTFETIQRVYNTGNLTLITGYENALSAVNHSAREGKLAKIANGDSGVGRGRKPKLTKEAYKEALEKEYTKERLMNEYSFNPKALGPMSRHYGPLKK